jgi:biopolymer transport protein ExbB
MMIPAQSPRPQVASFGLCLVLAMLALGFGWPDRQQASAAEAAVLPENARPVQAAAFKPTLFDYLLRSDGFIFGPLLMLNALGLLILVVWLALGLRTGQVIPSAFRNSGPVSPGASGTATLLAQGSAGRSLLGQALNAGVGRLPLGLPEARHAAALVAEGIKVSRERLIRYLAMIGILSPLIGLVGTLLGCILILREAAADRADMAQVASGVGYSLAVLMHGLILAVIAVFFYAIFKNRLNRLVSKANLLADDILTRLHPNAS